MGLCNRKWCHPKVRTEFDDIHVRNAKSLKEFTKVAVLKKWKRKKNYKKDKSKEGGFFFSKLHPDWPASFISYLQQIDFWGWVTFDCCAHKSSFSWKICLLWHLNCDFLLWSWEIEGHGGDSITVWRCRCQISKIFPLFLFSGHFPVTVLIFGCK